MLIPYKIRYLVRCLTNLTDLSAAARFLFQASPKLAFTDKLALAIKFYRISARTTVAHTEQEMFDVARKVISLPADVPGCIVEAGCYKGASTAKLSLIAKAVGRKLYAFDSFEGLPENDEQHGKTIFGQATRFEKGRYLGRLEEVKENIERYGDIGSCVFVKGWFDNTMPGFKEPVAVAYVDVDLVSSTKTCLKGLSRRIVNRYQ